MDDEHAGVYYHPKAENEYDDLPEESQDSLSAFLEAKRQQLEAHGGGRSEGHAAEWEPGHVVYWNIDLQPPYRGSSRRKARRSAVTHRTLGSYYWIEVIKIR